MNKFILTVLSSCVPYFCHADIEIISLLDGHTKNCFDNMLIIYDPEPLQEYDDLLHEIFGDY